MWDINKELKYLIKWDLIKILTKVLSETKMFSKRDQVAYLVAKHDISMTKMLSMTKVLKVLSMT